MRRLTTIALTTITLSVLSVLPALGTEGGDAGEAAKGSMGGVALAALLGLLFGIVLTVIAYRRTEFGEEAAHQEQAHDVREGFAAHTTPQPDVDEMPSGSP